MPRRVGKGSLLSLAVRPQLRDEGGKVPLSHQVYAAFRQAILDGRLGAGDRLPASRVMAVDLGVSRNTALAAIDQLVSEGYLETRRGSGCYVAQHLPDARPAPVAQRRVHPPMTGAMSRRGQRLVATPPSVSPPTESERPARWFPCFLPGMPDCSDFPFALWARLLARAWRQPSAALVLGGDPAGHRDLRQAIAGYLRQARGVLCDAEQVLVLSGIRQAVDLTCRLLLDPGDAVWLENPCYPGLRAAIAASAAKLVHVPVDDDGVVVDRALTLASKARLACVAPSHQFPLGAVLSLQRRLQLLAWAREARAWILEDDYDSEFRYEGRPLATLQSLDEDRVIYVGSLSKVMFPSLRVAYLVAPRALVHAFRSARAAIDEHPPMTPQPALAAFFSEGHLAAHVRRQRKRYAERQRRLLALAAAHLGGKLAIAPDPAGLHLLATPVGAAARRTDGELSRALAAAGIIAPPLGNYYVGQHRRRSGLLLGYAAVGEAIMEPAVKRMAEVLPG
jgi:GntR family transcriptional regulator/MocR family aminotransferase